MDPIREIVSIYAKVGEERYGQEAVSQLAHGLQCAELATESGATDEVITAALLHDIGHLVDSRFEQGQKEDIDRRHEDIGAAWLARWFPEAVTEPIRLHVDAKRYLCYTDDTYFDDLSEASIRSLRLQGGVFDAEEAAAFIAQPHAVEAVEVRKWDDLAKVPEHATRPLEAFVPILEKVMYPS